MAKRIGSRTIELTEDVRVAASAAVAGKKEGEGPLKDCFDYVSQDSYFAEDSWEKAETSMLRQCFGICRGKAGGAAFEPECVLGGDLLNQCVSSSFALKDSGLPYLGLYGACSTMAEALCLSAKEELTHWLSRSPPRTHSGSNAAPPALPRHMPKHWRSMLVSAFSQLSSAK